MGLIAHRTQKSMSTACKPAIRLRAMRLITLSALLVVLCGTPAVAQRHRDRGGHGRTIVRGHGGVSVGGSVDVRVRDRGGYRGGTVVRDHRVDPYRGQVRGDRREVYRRPLYQNNGRFTFHGVQTVVFRRPVIQHRHYDVNVRPQPIVESYPNQNGYVWVDGSWSWTGYEWSWTAGYYAPDPSYQTYYDDGSYDTYSNGGDTYSNDGY